MLVRAGRRRRFRDPRPAARRAAGRRARARRGAGKEGVKSRERSARVAASSPSSRSSACARRRSLRASSSSAASANAAATSCGSPTARAAATSWSGSGASSGVPRSASKRSCSPRQRMNDLSPIAWTRSAVGPSSAERLLGLSELGKEAQASGAHLDRELRDAAPFTEFDCLEHGRERGLWPACGTKRAGRDCRR